MLSHIKQRHTDLLLNTSKNSIEMHGKQIQFLKQRKAWNYPSQS